MDSQEVVKATERFHVPTTQPPPTVTSPGTIEHFKTRRLIGTINTVEYKSSSASTVLYAFIFLCVFVYNSMIFNHMYRFM